VADALAPDAPVTSLAGVGAKLAGRLGVLGVETVQDLLGHLPVRYVRIAEAGPISQGTIGELCRIRCRVSTARARPTRSRMSIVVADATDAEGEKIRLTWFGQRWLARQISGKEIVVHGKLTRGRPAATMEVRDHLVLEDGVDDQAGLRPVYGLTEGINQARMHALIGQALERIGEIPDTLPAPVRDRYALATPNEALRLIHQPESPEDFRRGRARLVFDELFPAQLTLGLLRRADARRRAPQLAADPLSDVVIANLPFALSPGQERVFASLSARLSSQRPLRCLVQGEVGAGKTVIAALACVQAAAHGMTSLIVTPTEILARQHAASIGAMLAPAGIAVELITAGQGAAERTAALARLADAAEDLQGCASRVAIGTHALLEAELGAAGERLALVVIDEQHRFGVSQRHSLITRAGRRGQGVHLIQLSATPIPRSLAMTAFGDMDTLTLPLRPEARRSVHTEIVEDDNWVERVRDAAGRGEASFVVCPRIGAPEDAVAVVSESLGARLAGLRVGRVHGRMPTDERAATLAQLAAGELDVLIATTVIEVGIDIPHASTIVVLEAERFGLAALHQLRGRVGRTGSAAECLLVPGPQAPDGSFERLGALVETDDGLLLAERDLALRGAGDLLGEQQAGGPGFRIARLERDGRILAQARHAARVLLRLDPTLAAPEHAGLRALIARRLRTLLRADQG